MMGALVYLQVVSTRNRLLARLKRLKQPKYLIGAIVGGLYLYFYFFRFLFIRSRQGSDATMSWLTPDNAPLIECIGALCLVIVVLLAWVIPNKRAALAFTEAEIAFLFPAPVSRRMLIQFKLLRSQLGILFSILILTLVFRRMGGSPWIHALGWWLVLSTLNLHFIASSFARTMLLDRGISTWKRRVVILGVAGAALAGTAAWAWTSLPRPAVEQLTDLKQVGAYLETLFMAGPLPYLLYPLRLLIRPYLAPDLITFLITAWPGFLILLLHYWWVVRSDVAFEEASVEASRRMAERVAARRSGGAQATSGKTKRVRSPFRLRPVGSQPVALLWKNLIATGQAFTLRIWITLAVIVLVLALSLDRTAIGGGMMPFVGMFAAVFLFWSLMLGPQFLYQDLRQDLKRADLLKMYPMNGWQVVLGELLAPAAILTAIQWLLIPLTVAGMSQLRFAHELSMGSIISFGIALGLVAPAMNLVSFIIPNSFVLLFPTWFYSDRIGAHGIETTGQRIILLVGQVLALALCAMPAAVVFLAVLMPLKWMSGWLLAAPVAGLAAAFILAAEATVALLFMGRWFERLDVSEEVIR